MSVVLADFVRDFAIPAYDGYPNFRLWLRKDDRCILLSSKYDVIYTDSDKLSTILFPLEDGISTAFNSYDLLSDTSGTFAKLYSKCLVKGITTIPCKKALAENAVISDKDMQAIDIVLLDSCNSIEYTNQLLNSELKDLYDRSVYGLGKDVYQAPVFTIDMRKRSETKEEGDQSGET